MRLIEKTQSICGKCQRVVSAEVLEEKGRTFIRVMCPDHGQVTSDHVWDDLEIYQGLRKITTVSGRAMQAIIDITKKCNLNCSICFARANEYQGNEFQKEDLDRLKGYRQVFLSGGEPTTREDLPEILNRCVKNQQNPILFTNGVKLANLKYLKRLKKAGLRSVLLQFDTLDGSHCEYIRGRNLVDIKIRALKNLNDLKIPTAIWTVAVKGKNIMDFGKIHRFVFKFSNVKTVSAIPVWRVGRFDKNDFVPPSVIIRKLSKIYGIDKNEFILTTRLVCNIDRILALFYKGRGRLFGVCMLKALVFESKGRYISAGKVFDLQGINERAEKIFQSDARYWALARLIGYLFFNQLFYNFSINRHFRSLTFQFVKNLRFVLIKRFLMVNPFRFITVGIFPNAENIDLNFIKPCNSYALDCDDYSQRPACLNYIRNEKKTATAVDKMNVML